MTPQVYVIKIPLGCPLKIEHFNFGRINFRQKKSQVLELNFEIGAKVSSIKIRFID